MSSRRWPSALFLILAMSMSSDAAAQTRQAAAAPEPIRYALSFPAPQTHYVEIEATVPTGGRPQVELAMAVWTPGSYLVREFSRHVEAVTARAAGQAQAVEKTAKNRWRVQTGRAASVTIRYRVYGREMGVRTNVIDADFALINGAATFLTLADDATARPHEVTLALPAGWKTSMTGMPAAAGGSAHHYRAADFDTLVDSPLVAGNPAVYEFTVKGKPHFLVNVGEGGIWDGPRSAADVQKIVQAQAAFWGDLPYDKYVFINVITEGSGGIEHKNSTVLMTSRWRTRVRRHYVDWLSLVSHEFFHTWNVKRLRPVELGPFEYERENYTKALWMAEGFTDYYADLLAARAGVMTPEEALAALSEAITALQAAPGRLVQSVEEASFDAWVRYYRPDENTPNSTISYYTKGAVVGFLLDLEIRRATDNARSLDDLMKQAYARYSGAKGYTSAEFRALASQVTGVDLAAWFHAALDTTDDLSYDDLGWLGLRFRPEPPSTRPWVGLTMVTPGATLRNDNGRLVVVQVRRGTPVFDAGVNAEDEIVAIGGYRVRPDQWEARLEVFTPGEKVPLLVARRERLVRLDVTPATEPAKAWRLEPDPRASDAAKARLAEWLRP